MLDNKVQTCVMRAEREQELHRLGLLSIESAGLELPAEGWLIEQLPKESDIIMQEGLRV